MHMLKHFGVAALLTIGVLAAANPPGVPKDAKEVAPGQYTFVDKDGKNWVYRKTPFGIQKFEDKSAGKSAADDSAASAPAPAPGTAMPTPFGETRSRAAVPVKVTEEGDSLRFERQTPFGLQRWTRKKTELNEQETALWEAQRSSKETPADKK